MGQTGETIASWFLARRGMPTLERNLILPEGEIDLVCSDQGTLVVVEVRTRLTDSDPIDAIDRKKRRQVIRLARDLGAPRVDLLGIGLGSSSLNIHWVPDAGWS